jgi:hypothetical protein
LGVQLAAENIPWLDLTPGGDSYKEHFATDHDVVFELTVYRNKARRWRRETIAKASRLIKDRLQAAGYRLADVMALVQKLTSPVTFGRQLCLSLKTRLTSRRSEFTYRGASPTGAMNNLPISKNSLRDLIRFDALGSPLRYRDFLHRAMGRMERCDDVYSVVQDGRLSMCCWVRTVRTEPDTTSSRGPSAPVSIVLSDVYVHRSSKQTNLLVFATTAWWIASKKRRWRHVVSSKRLPGSVLRRQVHEADWITTMTNRGRGYECS